MAKFLRIFALVLSMLAATLPGAQSAAAAAPPTLFRAVGLSGFDSAGNKSAFVRCPNGMRVIGGGGEIEIGLGANESKIVITQLVPVSNGTHEGYFVEAFETAGGTAGEWRIRGYAQCASPMPGLHIVERAAPAVSDSLVEAIARCPDNQRAIGSGGAVTATLGQVYLRLARTSGPGDIVRAHGHEAPGGYSGLWGVTAFAVCADPPQDYHVQFTPDPRVASQSPKAATADCPVGLRRYSGGLAVSNDAPAHIGISGVSLSAIGESATALTHEVKPTSASWNMIATAICAR